MYYFALTNYFKVWYDIVVYCGVVWYGLVTLYGTISYGMINILSPRKGNLLQSSIPHVSSEILLSCLRNQPT